MSGQPIPPGTIGVNLDGAEYTWSYYPSVSDLNYLQSEGVTLVRLPISWENFQPTLNGPLNQTQVADLESFLADAAAHGMQVVIDLHNFGRYNTVSDPASAGGDIGAVIGSAALPISDFANFWSQLATQLLGQPAIAGYDIMNEPNNMGSPSVWPAAAQAAVNAIRAVDMNTTIYVEGTGWASAENWLSYNANLHIVDPANNLVYEAHQYFDANQSGTYAQTYAQQGANPNIGVAEIQPFLQWLQQNNAQGFLGEFGVPNNDPSWIPVLNNVLNALQAAGVSGTQWYYDGNPLDQPGNSLALSGLGTQQPQWAALFAHTAPAITTISNDSGAIGDGVTNADVLTLTGTGAANSTVMVYDGTTQIGTTTASANGSWSFTTGTLANGAHSFTATDADSSGNISAASAALAVTVDTVAPVAPAIASFSTDSGVVGDHITNDNTLTLTGSAEANSTIKVYDGATLLGTATANGSGAWSYITAALSNGAHSFTATDTDVAGNTSVASAALSVTIDTTAPVAPAIASFSTDSGVVGDHITNDNTLTLAGTAEANSTIKVYDGATLLGTATANGSGAWSYVTAVLSNGAHSFTATDADVAGNTSAASAALMVTVDTLAPLAPVITSDAIVNVDEVVLTGTAEANSTVKIFEGATVLGTATAAANGTWSYTTAALTNGAHIFTATDTDVAGNTSLASQPLDPVIDTTVPAAPIVSIISSVGDGITNDNTLTLLGTAEANSTVKVYDGAALLGSTVVKGDGTWTYVTAALADGAHSLTTTDTDASGNTSAASTTLAVTVDTVAPTLAVTGINEGPHSVSLTGTAEAYSWISIVDSVSGFHLGTTTTAADGTWNFEETWTTATAVTVTATDLAGNNNHVDVIAPAPEFTNLVENLTSNVTLSGTSTAESTVTIYDGTDTTPLGTVTADANGSWSFSSGSLSNVVHDFTLKAVDVAGNTGSGAGAAIYGTTGNDTITVGPGPTLVTGGGGTDTFVFGPNFGKDVITDFQALNHDVLQFSQSTFSNFAAVLAHAAQVGSDVVITADPIDSVTLKNVQLASLQQNNIHIV